MTVSSQVPSATGYAPQYQSGATGQPNLADILERILDKGIVIAGDIQVNLLDVELLTIKIRLLVASVDKAKEMGINWWEGDPSLTGGPPQLSDGASRVGDRGRATDPDGRGGRREGGRAPGRAR